MKRWMILASLIGGLFLYSAIFAPSIVLADGEDSDIIESGDQNTDNSQPDSPNNPDNPPENPDDPNSGENPGQNTPNDNNLHPVGGGINSSSPTIRPTTPDQVAPDLNQGTIRPGTNRPSTPNLPSTPQLPLITSKPQSSLQSAPQGNTPTSGLTSLSTSSDSSSNGSVINPSDTNMIESFPEVSSEDVDFVNLTSQTTADRSASQLHGMLWIILVFVGGIVALVCSGMAFVSKYAANKKPSEDVIL